MPQSTPKVIRHKIGLLNLVEELGKVSKACQMMGLSRDTFYCDREVVEEAGEVGSLLLLGDLQLDGAGAGLPDPVAVALVDPIRRALAAARASQALHLQFHQTLGGEADHLAQQIGVRSLFQQSTKRHHVIDNRGIPWLQVAS